MEIETTTDQKTGKSRLIRWFYRDQYTITIWLIFLITAIFGWRGYVRKYEAMYLLGPHRVIEPDFLANDLTWSTLAPTNFLFDYLLAPLWAGYGDFGVTVVGRFVAWFLFAWSLALLARRLRLPAWSVVVGFFFWLLWFQRIAICGSPLEGLQPKLFAYSLSFFSLAFVMQGKMVRAGIASGVATLFHIIIGGWGWLAISLAILVNRKLFVGRQIGIFLLSSLLLIAPLVLAVGVFYTGDATSAERSLMDKIYVTFAMPHCCDPAFFMRPDRWMRVIIIFILAPLLIFLWPHKSQARILTSYTLMLILFFLVGMLAAEFNFYWFLKLYPFQLASALPALFLFIFCLALIGKSRPKYRSGLVLVFVGVVASTWLVYERQVVPRRIIEVQEKFLKEIQREEPWKLRYGKKLSTSRGKLYDWIRENTPRDSLFITPYLPDFWIYAERAQVASYRHPPYDKRLLEWKDRLQAINKNQRFTTRGFKINDELTLNQGQLSLHELLQMREMYGATYYVTKRRRADLTSNLLYDGKKYFVYGFYEEEDSSESW